jgi:hypothetical protein
VDGRRGRHFAHAATKAGQQVEANCRLSTRSIRKRRQESLAQCQNQNQSPHQVARSSANSLRHLGQVAQVDRHVFVIIVPHNHVTSSFFVRSSHGFQGQNRTQRPFRYITTTVKGDDSACRVRRDERSLLSRRVDSLKHVGLVQQKDKLSFICGNPFISHLLKL